MGGEGGRGEMGEGGGGGNSGHSLKIWCKSHIFNNLFIFARKPVVVLRELVA
jgi:hypothetical protein